MFARLLRSGKILFMLLAFVVVMPASAAEEKAGVQLPIKDLGGNRYQVGQIVIDKNKSEFRVPGKVIRTEPPLEFFAVTRGGFKAYESVFELDVDAFEFNLACILIGLDAEHATPAQYHFDKRPVEGDRVFVNIEWQDNGKTVSVPAEELLVEGKEATHPPSDWVYQGSTFLPNGQYLAQVDGVLVGFIHSPASVIEHHAGVGVGNYGSVSISDKIPALDTAVVFVVTKGGAN